MLSKVKARWEEGNFSTLQSRIVSKKMDQEPGALPQSRIVSKKMDQEPGALSQSRIVSKKMEKGPGKYKEVARRLKRALVEKDIEEEKKKEAAKMKRVRQEVEREMEKEDQEALEKIAKGVPKFPYNGPVVRKKSDRKKLLGYECHECKDYYKQKLEEGCSKEEVQVLMDKCSRHRGLFRPPLTPPRFWDPQIIEDSPEDPRVKVQMAAPLRRREERQAKVRARLGDGEGEPVSDDGF